MHAARAGGGKAWRQRQCSCMASCMQAVAYASHPLRHACSASPPLGAVWRLPPAMQARSSCPALLPRLWVWCLTAL